MRRLFFLKDSLVVLLLTGLCVAYFWPLVRQPFGQLSDDYDGVFIAWTLKTVGDKVLSLGQSFYDGGIFYPHERTLAFSDLYLSEVLLTLPLRLFTSEPTTIAITALILSQLLTMVMMYFWLHELSGRRSVALTGALVFAFSPLRLHYLGHLHTMSLHWVFFSLLALTKVTRIPSKPWLLVFLASFWLQMANSFLGGYFIILATLWWFLKQPDFRHHLNLMRLFVVKATGITGLLVVPLVWPYLTVSGEYEYVRPITDAIHFALSPDDLLTRFASPGLFFFILIGLVAGFSTETQKSRWQAGLTGLSLSAFLLALGPALKWAGQTIKIPFHIPLPYLFAYYLLPGFMGFRTPSRWLVLSAIAAVGLAALYIGRWPKTMRHFLLGLVLIITLFTLPALPLLPVPIQADYPQEYYYLKELPPGPTIELPMFRWGSDQFSKNEAWRMLYQSYHKQPLVNGYSGFSPPEWELMVARLQQHESVDWRTLVDMNIRYVLIHLEEFEQWARPLEPEQLSTDAALYGYLETARFGNTVIYHK
jgi:hypothetical protein